MNFLPLGPYLDVTYRTVPLWSTGIYFSCVFAELKCNALTRERQAEFAVFFKNLYNSKKYIDEFFYDETVQLFHVESFNELYPKHKTAQGAVLSPPVQYFCISALLKLPTPYLSLSRIIKNAIDRASSSGRYFKNSSFSDEFLLVPLPARPSGSVPTMHFFMMRLFMISVWEVGSLFLYENTVTLNYIRRQTPSYSPPPSPASPSSQ